jgi:hypothetical protein
MSTRYGVEDTGHIFRTGGVDVSSEEVQEHWIAEEPKDTAFMTKPS